MQTIHDCRFASPALQTWEPPPTRSWQAAPGLVTQSLQRQNSFPRRLRVKLPTGKQFDSGDLAFRRLVPGTFDPTFHIRHEVKRFAEHLFLLDAVRAPVKAVHLSLLASQALRERILFVIAVVP